jgi:hypothetical protein
MPPLLPAREFEVIVSETFETRPGPLTVTAAKAELQDGNLVFLDADLRLFAAFATGAWDRVREIRS